MPKWNQRIQTSRPIWIAFTVAAYGVFAAVLEVPFDKGNAKLWEIAWAAIKNFDKSDGYWFGIILLLWSIVLAIPCIGVGWIAQGIVLLVFPGLRPDRSQDLRADYQDGRPVDGTPWQSQLK